MVQKNISLKKLNPMNNTETPAKENSFLDLSKLSEDEQKEAITMLPIPELDLDYAIDKKHRFLYFDTYKWYVGRMDSIFDKTEITFSQFKEMMGSEGKAEAEKCEAGCKMFTGGEIKHHKNCVFYPESRTKMYDDLLINSLKLLGMFTELDSENKTNWNQEQINAVQYISDKTNN